jgi:hypothetical protein
MPRVIVLDTFPLSSTAKQEPQPGVVPKDWICVSSGSKTA